MLATTFGVGLIVAQSVLGWQGMEAGPSVRCGGCGLENSVVTAQLVRLQTSGRWRERERAAHELRRAAWSLGSETLKTNKGMTMEKTLSVSVRRVCVSSMVRPSKLIECFKEGVESIPLRLNP